MRQYRNQAVFQRLKVAFWILEILQFVLAIIILGLTGSASNGLLNELRVLRIPGKLAYNIAVASIIMLVFLAIIPLDLRRPPFWGRWNKIRSPWPRVILNVLFMVLSIGAIASSFYTCSDLCDIVTSDTIFIRYATVCCSCPSATENDCSFAGTELSVEQRNYRYEVTEAMDVILMLLFFTSTIILVAFHWVKAEAEAGFDADSGYEFSETQTADRSTLT